MDGMTIGGGGGFELGGGYVTIAGDLTPLRDAVAEARSLTEGLVAHDFVLRPRLDLTDARNAMAELKAEMSQLDVTGIAGMALSAGSMQGSSIGSTVGQAITNAVNNAVSDAVSNAANNTMNQVNVAGGAGGGGAGGAGGRHWYNYNLLSPRGLGRAIGGPLALYYAAESALTIGSTLDQAQAISHRWQQYVPNEFGGVEDFFSDPATVRAARRMAEAHASERELGVLEGVPLVGRAFNLDYFHAGNEANIRGAQRTIAGEQYLAREHLRLDVEAAQLSRDPVEIARARLREEEAPLAREASRTKLDIGRENPGASVAVMDQQWQQVLAAQQQLAVMQGLHAQELQYTQTIRQSGLDAQLGAGYTGLLRADALGIETARGAGADRAAMGLRQRAQYQDFATQSAADFDRARTPADQEAVRERVKGERAELEAKHAKERADLERDTQQELTTIQAQGEASRLRATGDAFGAEMTLFVAASENKLKAAQKASPEYIHALNESISDERQAMFTEQAYRGKDQLASAGLEISSNYLSVAASNLRMAGDPHAAAMLRFQDEDSRIGRERERARRLPSLQQGIEMAKLDARQRANDAARSESEFGYRREGALMGFQLEGGAQIARDTIADMPMTARADEEVMRARMEADELILAHPERRAQIIATEQLKLDAIAHQQFGFRSGGIARSYGSLDEALLATGFGMDLGGDARDRRNAQNVLNNGRGQVGVSIPGTEPAADAMGAAAARLEAAADRIAKTLAGVTLFTTGS